MCFVCVSDMQNIIRTNHAVLMSIVMKRKIKNILISRHMFTSNSESIFWSWCRLSNRSFSLKSVWIYVFDDCCFINKFYRCLFVTIYYHVFISYNAYFILVLCSLERPLIRYENSAWISLTVICHQIIILGDENSIRMYDAFCHYFAYNIFENLWFVLLVWLMHFRILNFQLSILTMQST